MSKTPPAWSFSSIKTFDTCPRKYQSEKVTKEVQFRDTEATLYGKDFHSAAEEYVRDGKPIEPRFGFIQPLLDKILEIPGEIHCELKMGIKYDADRLVPCDFFDPDVYFRGIADLVIIGKRKARIADYKTSKSVAYADTRQLALMAAALMLKYPHIEEVKAALLFVTLKDFPAVEAEYNRDNMLEIFSTLDPLLVQREAAYKHDVWNPKPNGLCKKWCQTVCPHNGSL